MNLTPVRVGAKVGGGSNLYIGRVTSVDPGAQWAEVRWHPGAAAYRYSLRYVRTHIMANR